MTADHVIPPDFWPLAGALLISLISGFVSIAQRIVRGHKASLLWVVSEFFSAIMCGWIAWDAYPSLDEHLPEWMTPIMFVAVAAHSGGRTFQGVENMLYRRYGLTSDSPPKKK